MLTRALGGAVAVVVALAPAAGAQTTTSYRTIGGDADAAYSALRSGPGWKRVVRTDLGATPARGRSVRRRSLTYFAQLSDFQLADEESPARVELLDLAGTPFTAAWRPQEALGPQTIDAMLRTVNAFTTSPIRTQRRRKRAPLRARMDFALTTGDSADNQQVNEVEWVVRLLEGGRLDPNSGVEGTCGTPADEAAGYTGVQQDGSARFWDPDAPAGDFAAFPRYPGLLDRAQRPFEAAGLRVPTYVTFGNHDGQVQGNVSANAAFEGVVTSCLKPLGGGGAVAVPSDPARTFASRARYMELHRTGRQGDAHGFALVDPAEQAAAGGQATYYGVTPRPGLRFLAINTVGEGAQVPGSEGNLDDPQFRWLEREIVAAAGRGELVVVFGHHPIRSLSNTEPDENARPCADPTSGPGCDADPRSSEPLHLGADLQALLLAHRNVIAFVAGHTHEHEITPFKRPDGSGGFWGIETASEVDWPIQSRLLEIFDNRDGTLSIFGTILDHDAPLRPPPPGPAAAFTETELASLARELSFNDPQAGAPGGIGDPQDRNVELLLPKP